MAETPASSSSSSSPPKGGGGGVKDAWFMRKVGPLPLWAYGLMAVGAYYWYTHYGPGASKQPAAQQQAGQQQDGAAAGIGTYAPKITETINYYTRRGTARGSGRPPAPRPASPAGTAGANINPGGVNRPAPLPGDRRADERQQDRRQDRRADERQQDRRQDRRADERQQDRRRVAVGSISQTADIGGPAGMAAPTGQAVCPDNGQPVYWEWTHAHRPPEVAYQVPPPQPQQAYAPGTAGATYDVVSAATDTAG